MALTLLLLIDDRKCFEEVRAMRWGKTKVSGTVFVFFGPSMGSESAFQAKTGDNIR